jgi:hypothetical protein
MAVGASTLKTRTVVGSHASIGSGFEATADAAAPDTLPDAESLQHDWTVAKWLASLGVSKADPDGMIAGMLAQALTPQSSNGGHNELQRIRELAESMSVKKLETALQDVCTKLAKELHIALVELAEQNTFGVPPDVQSKFAGGMQLSFSGLDTFFGGLESLVGAPAPKVREAMQAEHTDRVDSDAPFESDNYGVKTSSKEEWWFVVEPSKQKLLPTETRRIEDDLRRKPLPLSKFQNERDTMNHRLKELSQPAMIDAALIGGRLYTGPLYVKYNSVLPGCRESDALYWQTKFKELCGPAPDGDFNRYTTTLHVINSCIVKMSKLTKATRVYRGVSDKSLSDFFWTVNEFGVSGGIEAAFMSTTRNRDVAMGYAKGKTGLLFEMQMGMVDRGADLAWLSQYPHEKEVLFGPLSGLEVQSMRVDGSVLIVETQLSINLASLTIEQVFSKRRKVVQDMCEQLQFGLNTRMALDDKTWRGFLGATCMTAKDVADYMGDWHKCYSENEPEYYNEDSQLGAAIAEVVLAASCVSLWPERFQRLGRTASAAQEHLLGAEELVLGKETAHGNGAAVAALLVANKKLAKLDLTSAELSTEKVVMVAAASNWLQVLVLDGNDVDIRGLDALAQAMMKKNFLRVLHLTNANATDGGWNQQALVRFCVGLEKNKTLTDLGCALPPT